MDVFRYVPKSNFLVSALFLLKKMMMDSLLLTILEIINLVLITWLGKKWESLKIEHGMFLNKSQY
jgi:hypothetical protein